MQLANLARAGQFLSTPSARRATFSAFFVLFREVISIHALREEGDGVRGARYCCLRISIHALREEGDLPFCPASSRRGQFLSTPSARRATRVHPAPVSRNDYFYPRPPRGGRRTKFWISWPQSTISIHALREEGDTRPTAARTASSNFYPRPPRGGRRQRQHRKRLCWCISIHALREEGDKPTNWTFQDSPIFLSTPSARRAT